MPLGAFKSLCAWLDARPSAKWIAVVAVLMAGLTVGAWRGYRWLMNPQPGKPDITLDSSLEDWIKATSLTDAGCYLDAAVNYAAGRGIVWRVPGSNPVEYGPFYYWGPGAPWALGQWLRHMGGETAWSCFWFNVTALFLFGVIALATATLYTRQTSGLVLTAALAGFCPPLQEYFFSTALTCSEVVCLVPLAAMTFALCRAFQVRVTDTMRLPPVVWFAVAGVCLGAASLARDSLHQFGTFVALFLVAQAIWKNWRQVGWAVAYSVVLIACVRAARYPVERWNMKRIDLPVVSTSSQGSVWRFGLWTPHDAHAWHLISGVGFGHYLDPEAAARVEAYYQSGQPRPDLYSLGQLAQAVWKRPLAAMEFKAARLPVLWLGTYEWPRCVAHSVSVWCVGIYALFAGYLAMRIRSQLPVPEPLFLFPLFLVCAMPLIHFEFRYSFPAWHMLVILPALWAGHRAEPAAVILLFPTAAERHERRQRAAA